MKAKDGIKYAIINNNLITQIFTKDEIPLWDENSLFVKELSKEQETWVEVGFPYDELSDEIIEPPLDVLKALALDRINLGFNLDSNFIKGEYIPADEQLSWSLQENEAQRYLTSKDISDAPTLQILANTRGVTLDILANKVLEKSKKYKNAIALLVGTRQKFQDVIESAKRKEEVVKIEWISPL